jgi:hypothetical protein
VTLASIIRVPKSPSVWGESEWQGYWQTPGDQRHMVVNPPAPDSARDDTGTPEGWTVAAAIERDVPGDTTSQRQRVIVVASSGWFLDAITQSGRVIDGRRVESNPGNLELFESAVFWLARSDELIARSATAEAAPLIPALSQQARAMTSWGLVIGLPIIVLLVGATIRLIRG